MEDSRKMKKGVSPSLMGRVMLLLLKIGLCAIFLVIVFTMIFGLAVAKDETMNPSVREGDIVLYYKYNKDYHARDLVMVEENGKKYVRRVIATAGDKVDMNEDGILINGYKQQENEVYTDTEAIKGGIKYPITIKEGQIFVMGDDRPSSRDSRLYGPVDVDSATGGKVLLVLKRRHL